MRFASVSPTNPQCFLQFHLSLFLSGRRQQGTGLIPTGCLRYSHCDPAFLLRTNRQTHACQTHTEVLTYSRRTKTRRDSIIIITNKLFMLQNRIKFILSRSNDDVLQKIRTWDLFIDRMAYYKLSSQQSQYDIIRTDGRTLRKSSDGQEQKQSMCLDK
jgi:hypothetical protein